MNPLRVGVFDSGLGGLSVWREIVRLRPDLDTLYVADQSHIPYGSRSPEEIRGWSLEIARFLVAEGCAAVVVACNTASAMALETLRAALPGVPFVGMEPAVKPAASTSQRRVIGVLATPATFQGELFASTAARFAAGVEVVQQVCPGLVERIEAGAIDDTETEAMLRDFLRPSLAAGADAIVLACTHYAFVRPLIERIAGPGVAVIDPAPAVARQVDRILGPLGFGAAPGAARFFTSGDPARAAVAVHALLELPVAVEPLRWDGGLRAGTRPA